MLIRPDGIDPMARPVTGMGSAPQPAPSQPVAAIPPAAGCQAGAAPASARNGGGPLSLEPQAGDTAPSNQPAPRAAAARRPHPSSPRSRPLRRSASGGYVVQISSQRSEADAQASFRSLQSKYPSQLGDREAIVRRADLGPKGIFYRAMVGPFGSAGDADQFCGGLKAAGGQCIVQKN